MQVCSIYLYKAGTRFSYYCFGAHPHASKPLRRGVRVREGAEERGGRDKQQGRAVRRRCGAGVGELRSGRDEPDGRCAANLKVHGLPNLLHKTGALRSSHRSSFFHLIWESSIKFITFLTYFLGPESNLKNAQAAPPLCTLRYIC